MNELRLGNYPHWLSFGHFSAMLSLLKSDFYVTFVMFLPVFICTLLGEHYFHVLKLLEGSRLIGNYGVILGFVREMEQW